MAASSSRWSAARSRRPCRHRRPRTGAALEDVARTENKELEEQGAEEPEGHPQELSREPRTHPLTRSPALATRFGPLSSVVRRRCWTPSCGVGAVQPGAGAARLRRDRRGHRAAHGRCDAAAGPRGRAAHAHRLPGRRPGVARGGGYDAVACPGCAEVHYHAAGFPTSRSCGGWRRSAVGRCLLTYAPREPLLAALHWWAGACAASAAPTIR